MKPHHFGMKIELDIKFSFVMCFFVRLVSVSSIYHFPNDGEQPSICPSREIIGR